MEAEPSKPAAISFDDLALAYEFVSSGQKFENEAFICTNTGSIYYNSAMTGLNELPEDAEETGDYVAVPHKNDLDLGRDLAFAFVDQHLPAQSNAVRDIFHSKGVYRRFKHMLESRGILERRPRSRKPPPIRRCARGARRSAST